MELEIQGLSYILGFVSALLCHYTYEYFKIWNKARNDGTVD